MSSARPGDYGPPRSPESCKCPCHTPENPAGGGCCCLHAPLVLFKDAGPIAEGLADDAAYALRACASLNVPPADLEAQVRALVKAMRQAASRYHSGPTGYHGIGFEGCSNTACEQARAALAPFGEVG